MATHCGCQSEKVPRVEEKLLRKAHGFIEFSNPCGYLAAPNRSQRRFLMLWRQKVSLVVLALFVGALSACGHSEEEWQAKLKENQELQNQLNAEKAAHQKAESDLGEASKQID